MHERPLKRNFKILAVLSSLFLFYVSERMVLKTIPLDVAYELDNNSQNKNYNSHHKEQCLDFSSKYFSYVSTSSFHVCSLFFKNAAFIDENHDVFNVLAAVVVAAFTFTLWRSTKGLWLESRRQLQATTESSEHQLRAYVYAEDLFIIATAKGPQLDSSVRVNIKNFGQTPAYDVRHHSWVEIAKFPINKDFVVTDNTQINKLPRFSVAPSHIATRNNVIFDYPVRNSGEIYYVFGIIKYFDTFRKKERTTKYCFGIFLDEFLERPKVSSILSKVRVAGGEAEVSDEAIFEIAAIHNEAD